VRWGRIDDRDRCRLVYKGFRFPPEIISHCVWLYHRFPLMSAPAVGGRLPTSDGRPLRGLERDHRGDNHGRRLNRRLGQDVRPSPRLITPNHHIGQSGWLNLTVPYKRFAHMRDT
jgi:hypothetical protein